MKKFFQKWLLGWLGVYMYARRGRFAFFGKNLIDYIMKKALANNHLKAFSPEERLHYQAVIESTHLWHGTGMYQYRDGSAYDCFEQILKARSLTPSLDALDIEIGDAYTISTSVSRIYARIYADMHEFGGADGVRRYGKTFIWAYFFIVSLAIMAVYRMKLWRSARRRRRFMTDVIADAEEKWSRKVTQQPFVSWKHFFTNGSDIQENTGVLIGINHEGTRHETSSYIAMYEVRLASDVPISEWTHLEVPDSQVDRIKRMLADANVDTPVFAIEKCEEYWSHLPFHEIVLSSRVTRLGASKPNK